MISRGQGHGRALLSAFATGLRIWAFCAFSGMASGGDFSDVKTCSMGHKGCSGKHRVAIPAVGTLGYGPAGVFPGFQGFGLGYHPGYGYGGDALGVGAGGGYPFYGGPGYPHPWPTLRRLGGITPFPFFGGPGYPTPGCSNYFGSVGPLYPDPSVVSHEPDPSAPGYGTDYGVFDGMTGDPETTFAPFVTRAATGGSSSEPGSNAPQAPDGFRHEGRPEQTLGMEVVPVAGPARGLKISAVSPGGLADKAGLRTGDVILTINGYVIEQVGHLAWILMNADPSKILNLSVLTASDGGIHPLSVPLP